MIELLRRLTAHLRFCIVITACMLGTLSCQPLRNDPGRELVNASGYSKDETLTILNKGVDINVRSSSIFGWTPLISAIYHHNEDVVDLLLARGADVNKGDEVDQTPIVWAIEMWGANTNLVAKLVSKGADPYRRGRLGSNAFDAARGEPNSAELLNILETASKRRGQ